MHFARQKLRTLRVGEAVQHRGIRYERLMNDGRWSVNVMVRGTRFHRLIGLDSEGVTFSQAQDAIHHLRSGLVGVVPKRRSNEVVLTISEVAGRYLATSTERGGKNLVAKEAHLRIHIVPALGRVKIDALTGERWLAYRSCRSDEGAAPATINRERSTLVHMLRWALRHKLIKQVPELERLREAPGKVAFLRPEQLERLLAAAEGDACESLHQFIMIGAYTGMRQESILQLRVCDVDTERRLIRVSKDKAGARDQPMPRRLAAYLKLKLHGMQPDEYLFRSSRSKRNRIYQMNSQLARCVRRADLPRDITPHALRHTMATNAARAGIDPATIQGMGGWKTRAMVERYTHAQELLKGMEKLERHYANAADEDAS